MTACVVFFSTLACPYPSGSRLSPLLLISLIGVHAMPRRQSRRSSTSSVLHPPIAIYGYLAACATPTKPPQLLTNSVRAPLRVFSWDTQVIIVAIGALISIAIASSHLTMWCLMRLSSCSKHHHLPQCHPCVVLLSPWTTRLSFTLKMPLNVDAPPRHDPSQDHCIMTTPLGLPLPQQRPSSHQPHMCTVFA